MKGIICFAALALISGLPALPQGGGPGFHGRGRGGPHAFAGGPRGGRVVTGAPYSATVTNTVVQQMANGGTIQRLTSGVIARDRDGRSYEQETITGGPLSANGGSTTLTFISDPTVGYSYVLNSTKKTAIRRAIRTAANDSGAAAPPQRQRHPNSEDVVEADLEPDSSSGVMATGKSFTRTIPAGKIGNSQPIVSSSSTWYSPDLQIVVKAVRNDPRYGTSTYALTNIVTKDPDPTLFQVPAGYTVTDAPQHGMMHGGPALR